MHGLTLGYLLIQFTTYQIKGEKGQMRSSIDTEEAFSHFQNPFVIKLLAIGG